MGKDLSRKSRGRYPYEDSEGRDMAELILTDEEKKMRTWVELDDESLGRVVKADMFKVKEASEERERLLLFSAAMILCAAAADTNADKLIQTIKGLTTKGQPLGNWKVTVRRLKA